MKWLVVMFRNLKFVFWTNDTSYEPGDVIYSKRKRGTVVSVHDTKDEAKKEANKK